MEFKDLGKVLDHPIRKDILQSLVYREGLSFSDLRNPKIPSNKFNFHLKSLIDLNFVKKGDEKYYLTQKGKKISNYIDVLPMKFEVQPTSVVLTVVEHEGNILLQKRTKEPCRGFYGLIAAKCKSGEELEKTLRREVEEETGLIVDGKLRTIFSEKVFEGEEFLMHNLLFVFKAKPIGGQLKDCEAGEHEWIKKSEIDNYKIFLDIPPILKEIEDSNRITFREVIWDKKNDEFIMVS